MALYTAVFQHVVFCINESLSIEGYGGVDPKDVFAGVLDIFGFEVFPTNYFEQLCINYANEKLHQFFVRKVLGIEQMIYLEEGIVFKGVEFEDNQPCVDLIEGKRISPGILSLLDDECRTQKSDDNKYLKNLYSIMGKRNKEEKQYFFKPRFARNTFEVLHFAGNVVYCTEGFVVKNKNQLCTWILLYRMISYLYFIELLLYFFIILAFRQEALLETIKTNHLIHEKKSKELAPSSPKTTVGHKKKKGRGI